MGILGPTFKAEVGDIIRVHLKVRGWGGDAAATWVVTVSHWQTPHPAVAADL